MKKKLLTNGKSITAQNARLTGAQSGNYALTVLSAEGEITPKVVNLELKGLSKRAYDGTASNVTAAARSLLPDDEGKSRSRW